MRMIFIADKEYLPIFINKFGAHVSNRFAFAKWTGTSLDLQYFSIFVLVELFDYTSFGSSVFNGAPCKCFFIREIDTFSGFVKLEGLG